MAVQGLHTLVLQVSDLDASLAYYEAALGVRFARQSERAVQAKVGSITLLLHRDYEPLPERRGAGVHINFAVGDASAHHAELAARDLAPSAIEVKPLGLAVQRSGSRRLRARVPRPSPLGTRHSAGRALSCASAQSISTRRSSGVRRASECSDR